MGQVPALPAAAHEALRARPRPHGAPGGRAWQRIAPGEDVKEVQDALYDLIRDAASPLEASIETAYGEGSAAFYQDPTSPLVLDLARLADQEATTAEFGTNALKYGPIADECVVFGPGSIDQAHQAIEWVDIAQLERAVDIYRAWLIQ